jgi:hypothetical protein
VDLVRIDVSEERIASIIRVTRIGELGTTLTVTNNRGVQEVLIKLGAEILRLVERMLCDPLWPDLKLTL